MIPPSLDFTSELFDPYEALHSNEILLPYPKIKTYNNIAEYYSHTFLKKGFESDKLSKIQVKPRERNYEWYYDTLGLSEYQRNFIQCTKKKKKRPGKKPVSVVTIPGSPLRSKKVTFCKSNFKEYCRRKYRSLNIPSTITDSKSEEFETFPLNNDSVSSSVIKAGFCPSTSVLPFIKLETTGSSSTSFNSTETKCPFSLFGGIKSWPDELVTPSSVKASELPSTSCVVKSELSDSSNDSFTDDVLIFKMKSNLQKACTVKNAYEFPVSFQRKHKPLELSSKTKHLHIESKDMHNPHQTINGKKLLKISKSDHLNSSHFNSLNACSNIELVTLNDSKTASSSKDSNASVNIQKKHSKKHKNSTDGDLNLKRDHKTPKHKKKQSCSENKDGNSCVLDCCLLQKCVIQNSTNKEKSKAYKENNSVNDSKSNSKSIKKHSKSALKSQENVLDFKRNSIAIEVDSKSNNIVSKIKTENSAVINYCTCSFPCGLSNLCTCGYYANAKEALSKFKIPRKKK